MTIAAGKIGPWAGRCPKWALGLGAIAPDIALYALSFGGIWYFGQVRGMDRKEVAEHLFQNLYYNDPWWIGSHNFFHSPTMLAILILIALTFGKVLPSCHAVCRWCLFFLAACLLHSVVDILTHFDDGPVMFFPFDWQYRFSSPVSYWDPAHYGKPFLVFESVLDICLLGFLMSDRWRKSRGQRVNS